MSPTSTLDIEKIASVLCSLEDTEKVIERGSDEHLDLILDIRNGLSKSTGFTQVLIEYIEASFNTYTAETARELIDKVSPFFVLAGNITVAAKETGIFDEVKEHLNAFETEVNELREIIDDLSKYKVRSDNDYGSLFND